MRLRGRLGPPRRDDDLAWLSAYASGPHMEKVQVKDFRPERLIDRPMADATVKGAGRG